MSAKVCTKCSSNKPIAEFSRDRTRRDGLFPWCKACAYQNVKRWVADNTSAVRAREARWRAANADHVAQYARRWADQTGANGRRRSRYEQERDGLTDWYLFNRVVNAGLPRAYVPHDLIQAERVFRTIKRMTKESK